jgi:hypothetical protein
MVQFQDIANMVYFTGVLVYVIVFCLPPKKSLYSWILRKLKRWDLTDQEPTGDPKSPYSKLQPRDIIQIDATVIAGALILLTLTSFDTPGKPSSIAHVCQMTGLNLQSPVITATIVSIFAFSAIATSICEKIEVGRRLMIAGFVYIFWAILLLTYFC